jgi:TonB-dependent receptor
MVKSAIFCLLMAFCLSAKSSVIKGIVSDKSTGKPIPGVIVAVEQTGIKAISDAHGYYTLQNAPAGKLLITFSAENYKSLVLTVSSNRPEIFILNAMLEKTEIALKEVSIADRLNPRADLQARIAEKNMVQLTDIISGNFIDKSASLSAADVAQNLPGVTVSRTNEGNTDRALIRGMDPKYSYTMLNGLKIPTTDDRSRYISLDIFSAELLQTVEVYKSLTADMEGDAVAGVVNLVTRDATEDGGLKIALNTGYNGHYFSNNFTSFNSHVVQSLSPYQRFGAGYYATGADFSKDNLSFQQNRPLPDFGGNLLYSKSFADRKIGLVLAGGYKNSKTGSDGFFISPAANPQLNNVPAFTDFNKRTYDDNKINGNVYGQIKAEPAQGQVFNAQYLFLNQQDIETRSTVDTSLALGRSEAGTGRIYVGTRSRIHTQQLNDFSLKGSDKIDALTINWTGVYAVAKGNYPDEAELIANTGRLLGPGGAIEQEPYLLGTLNRSWLSNTEINKEGYLDVRYKPALFNQKLTLSAGGVISYKTRDNFYNTYTFVPVITQNNGQPFTNIYNAQFSNNNGPQDPLGDVNNPNTYKADERISAWYIQANYQAGRSVFTAGLRNEKTDQHVVSSLDPTLTFGKIITINYSDLLPNLHWKYHVNDQQLIRADYFRGITRPALSDVTFAGITYEDYQEAGNPFLIRTTADNFDLRYEWYQPNAGLLKGGIFYKSLSNVFERTLLNGNDELYPIPSQGLSYTPAGELTEQLRNTGNGTNYGAEASFSRNLGKLEINASYTFLISQITRIKKENIRQDPGDPSSNIITVTRPESGPLEGQAKNSGSLSLFYKQLPGDISARFTLIYTGRRIDLVSPWYGLDNWQNQILTANFYAEKPLGKKFKISLGANNLFNAGISDEVRQPNPAIGNLLPGQTRSDRITVLKENFSTYYTLGLSYRLR